MSYEIIKQNLKVERQIPIPVVYKEIKLECGYRLDILVEDKIIIEIKSVDYLAKIHEAQLLTYLKFSGKRLGLLLNFNVEKLSHGGIKRFIM